MATGSIIGGLLGAGVGALGGAPQAGYAIGSGIGGTIEGMLDWNRGNNMNTPNIDPRQRMFLSELQRRRRLLDSGAMYDSTRRDIYQGGAQAMNAATSVTGGDIGATVSALSNINRSTGSNVNKILEAMSNQSMQLYPLENQLTESMANRDYAIRQYDKQQTMTHGAQMLKDGLQVVGAGVARSGGVGAGGNNTGGNGGFLQRWFDLLSNNNDNNNTNVNTNTNTNTNTNSGGEMSFNNQYLDPNFYQQQSSLPISAKERLWFFI